ncbi:MAG: hypothetical protein ABL907_25250 [Hyphomicrobium sp.]
MSAFDEIERTLNGGATPLMTPFAYLNESARPEAAKVRAVVDQFLANYPPAHRQRMRDRLRQLDDVAHHSAFFELLLHELLIRQRCEIIAVEPEIPGNRRSPDFLVVAPNGSRFYLEATLATGRSQEEAAARRRFNEAMNALDRMESPDFFLDIRWEGMPNQPVAGAPLRREVSGWLQHLDYDEARQSLTSGGPVPSAVFERHGWHITVQAMARGPNTRGRLGLRAIGSFGHRVAQMIQPHLAIKNAVTAKAGRYGDLGLPYIVAVNAMADIAPEDSDTEALFGTEAVEIVMRDDGFAHREVRNADGAWRAEGGPQYTRVSAVLSTSRLTPWSLGQRRMRLILNPWARRLLTADGVGFDRVWVENERLHTEAGLTPSQILNLAEGWPGTDDEEA